MKLFKTVTDLTKNTLPKLQITHSKPDKDAQDLENCRHTESCCMQEPQSALALCDKQAEIESQQLFSDGDQLKGLDAQSRGPVKLEYISKVNCQDSDSDMSPELESKGGNALKGIEMNQKTALKDAKGGEKRSNSQKGKENQANGFLDVKRPIGEKRSSFSAAGVKLFKDAFTRKWREQRKSVTEAPRFSAGKTSADVAMEMDEQDQEQIQQMSRKNLYARSVIDLKDSNCPEIAQEDNPLSNGKLKLAMEQKMRPAKSVEKGVNHAQGMKVKIDNLNTFGSFSKLPVVLEYEGTKGETRTTLDRSPKTGSAHTVLSLTSFTHKAAAKKQSTPVVLPSLKKLIEGFVEYGIVLPVCAVMLYCVLPFGLLFVAHDYGNREIRIGLNFGFLGLLQGLVKIFLVRYMVDRPIRRKIKELEGSDSGLIESKKYKLLSPFKIVFMMMYAIGAQVSSGVAIERLGYSVNSVSVLISFILITMIGALLWAVIVLVQTPPKIENKKKILTKELSQINKLRKDFLKELHTTRRELDQNAKDLQNGNDRLEKKQATENTYLACVGATTGIHNNLKADIKKFRCEDLAKYSEEIIKIRFNVFKVYGMLIVLLFELLALVKVLRGVSATEDVAALGFLVIIPVIGAVFAIIESCRSSTSRRHLVSVMKIINMIVIGGAYRFFYLVAPNHGVMIGAVVLKFIYKILMHYVPLFCHEKIATFIRGNSIVRLFSRKKDSAVHFYRSNEDKEASSVRPIRYLLQKFIFLKMTDSYFGIGSLMLLGASINWFPQLNIKLGLRIDDFSFYIGLVVIEFLIDILLLIHFSLLAKRAVKQKSKTMAISVRGELKNVIAERKMLIITVKAMILFLLVFTFVNQL